MPVPESSLLVVWGLSAPAPSRGALLKAKKLLLRAFIHRSSVFWKAIAYHSWRYESSEFAESESESDLYSGFLLNTGFPFDYLLPPSPFTAALDLHSLLQAAFFVF